MIRSSARRRTVTTLTLTALSLPLAIALATGSVAVEAPPADLPLVPTDLLFAATVPADPQRDAGEPAVTMDRKGNIYTCGISGFSQVADYAQISDDNGDQFHLLGTPPRGQISFGEGGGDCALGTSPVPDTNGNYTLAYAGLGPLTNFSTFSSSDTGRTLKGSPISESIPGVDRQWITFTDVNRAFLTYNAFPSGSKVVQRSNDGGLTYLPAVTAANQGGRIGQIRSFLPPGETNPDKAFIYVPYGVGNMVKIALSQDGGATFSQCLAVNAGVDPNSGFVAADHDDAGNVYVSYSERGGGRDTYVVAIGFEQFKNCKGTSTIASQNNVDPGFSPKVRINRGGVETSMFSWVSASGAPGRIAVASYGTRSVGDPDSGAFNAAWDVYVNQILDFVLPDGSINPTPSVSQVKATTHPFHYDSICTAGLACTINMADRSLIDYFTMELNEKSGKLALVYNQAAKKPDDPVGFVATPAVLVQVGGPSNAGDAFNVDGGFRKQVLRTSSPDPDGDALSNYSFLVAATNAGSTVLPPRRNEAPLDFVGTESTPAVTVGPEVTPATGAPVANGGFTVTMKMANLSNPALQTTLTNTASTSLTWLFRFVDGYQSAAAVAFWDPVQGFRFGFNGYETGNVECGINADEKCLVYPGNQPILGKADQAAGTITMSVPLSKLTALGGPDSTGQRPVEQPAQQGSRIYDATAFSLANPATQQVQTFMTTVDNAPAFDFLIGASAAGVDPVVPEAPLTVLLPLAALGLAAGGYAVRRRRAGSAVA